ncbi:MAG: ATP-binding protein [Acidobacteria bacterium]|nr:ATP-binding protein [Acidobacteriota bacterium]
MIHNLTKDDFVKILQAHLSPTAPIQSQEYLFGRDAQVRKIEQALYSPGRSIFIYGDRGVGKTSLAQTVAFSHQSANHDPIMKVCDANTTFTGLMSSLAKSLSESVLKQTSVTKTTKIGLGPLSYEMSSKAESGESASQYFDLNEAVRIMKGIGDERGGSTVVIVDEFDRIANVSERIHFADFIKQIGDQRIGIHFIFCGVAESLDQLLGSHDSCYRYLESVELSQLSWEARWKIIDYASAALNISVGNRPRFRIAAISDGFPHYVHLVCEKLFWQMFNDKSVCDSPTAEHYENAIGEAVLGIEQRLRKAYEKATVKDASGYEEILWAMADNSNLIRNTSDIYESYCAIMKGLEGKGTEITILDRQTFTSRVQALKSTSCGHILSSNRRGFCHFTENIIRGYVRLRAEEIGLELASDIASDTKSSSVWTKRSVPHQRIGYSVERGWFGRPRYR